MSHDLKLRRAKRLATRERLAAAPTELFPRDPRPQPTRAQEREINRELRRLARGEFVEVTLRDLARIDSREVYAQAEMFCDDAEWAPSNLLLADPVTPASDELRADMLDLIDARVGRGC